MNNDKLMLALLSNIYGDKAQHLLAICNATPQPVVALEMLAGLYETPDLGASVRLHKNHYREFVATRTSFDALASDQVCFTGEVSKTVYFTSEADATKFSKNGGTYSMKCQAERSDEFYFDAVYVEKVNGSCSVSDWLNYAPVAEQLAEQLAAPAELVDVLC